MQSILEKFWYSQHPLRWVLWPLSFIYETIIKLRRIFLQRFKQQHFSVPIIVVGNLTVGGVGKTPLVIALVKVLQAKGLRVGVVSRGYGATVSRFPHAVNNDDEATTVGDEPLLIARKTGCPVIISPDRVEAVRFLLDNYNSQIIISDDGLQHYKMGRAVEIVVIDGVRGLGNRFCLPVGPLRENKNRLKTADILVVNSGEWPDAHQMTLQAGQITNLVNGSVINKDSLAMPVAAVAAIGHPQRFYNTLNELGIGFKPYSFTDHHFFTANDLHFTEKEVIMTEKDAVKCKSFAKDKWYYLPVEARLDDAFWQVLWSHEQLKDLF